MESQGTQRTNIILKEEQRLEDSNFLISKLITVIRRMWYWHNIRHIHQTNRKESPEISPHIYHQMIFDKDCQNHSVEKSKVFLTNNVGKTRYPHTKQKTYKKMKLGASLVLQRLRLQFHCSGHGFDPSQGSSVCCEMQPKRKKTRKLLKKMKLRPYLTPYSKLTYSGSKTKMKDLKLKTLRENVEQSFKTLDLAVLSWM